VELCALAQRIAQRLAVAGIADEPILLATPQLDGHADVPQGIRSHQEAQAGRRHDQGLDSWIMGIVVAQLRCLGVQQRRVPVPEQLANELGRLGAMVCNLAQVRPGAGGGQQRGAARGEPIRPDPARVDGCAASPHREQMVDGDADLPGASADPGHGAGSALVDVIVAGVHGRRDDVAGIRQRERQVCVAARTAGISV